MRAVREKGKKDVFRWKDWKDVCFVFQVEAEVGAQLLRPWGIGTAAKTSRTAVARGGARVETQLVAACGLWLPNPAYPAYRP